MDSILSRENQLLRAQNEDLQKENKSNSHDHFIHDLILDYKYIIKIGITGITLKNLCNIEP